MTARRPCLVWVLLLTALGAAAADVPRTESPEAERLVQRLGSPRFSEREAAYKALDALGPAALTALRRAAGSPDAEIRRRAGDLLSKLERAADAADAFAPTKVHLKAVDAPLADVVRDLTQQSRVRLQLAREPADLAGRRMTFDTGETTFWEALDALCRTARMSIRPATFEPTATAGNPPIAGMAAVTVMTSQRIEEPLVLQDGVLPECPTAYIGAVRVRLVPDRWSNRERRPGEEHRWALEVLSEPRVNWQSVPAVRFEPAAGLTVTAPGAPANSSSVSMVSRASRGVAASLGPVTRHELPVALTADRQPGPATVSELRGTLAASAQLTAQHAVTVAEVLKPGGAGATGPDGTKVSVRDCQVNADGSVSLKVEVERPTTDGMMGGSMTSWGGAGVPVASAVYTLANYGRDGESVRLCDAQDQPYTVTLRVNSVGRQNGPTTVTYTAEAKPAAPGAQPKKLELHCPRRAPIEARFSLRNVPVP